MNAVICTSVSLTLKDAVTTEMPREAQPAHHMTAALGTTPHCLSTTLPVGKTQSSRPDVKHVRSTIGLGITAAKRKTPVTFRYSSIPKASISSHQQVPPGRATQRVHGWLPSVWDIRPPLLRALDSHVLEAGTHLADSREGLRFSCRHCELAPQNTPLVGEVVNY